MLNLQYLIFNIMPDYSDSDNDSYNSYNENDYDNEFYDPEENSLTKYNIVLCERYNKYIHGVSNEANYHYLTHLRLKVFDANLIEELLLENPRCKIEIAECKYLPSEHCISILKTYWLRLIQRVWKRIYNDRQAIIKLRSNIYSLKYREINGMWPDYCISYPSLKGMLYNLSRGSS